jgi:hypothetical protein
MAYFSALEINIIFSNNFFNFSIFYYLLKIIILRKKSPTLLKYIVNIIYLKFFDHNIEDIIKSSNNIELNRKTWKKKKDKNLKKRIKNNLL